MGKWKRSLIMTLVLLFMKVLSIQSGCSGDTLVDCTFNCETKLNFPIGKVMEYLNNNQVSNCNGIHLKLTTSGSISNNWFTAEVKVKELSIISSLPLVIDVDAFDEDALKTMKKLVISINSGAIKKGIFNGLESLEVLNIKRSTQSRNDQIDGLLDILNETLKEFYFDQSSILLSEVTIDGITGSVNMKKLENVTFLCNLPTSINRRTFSGLSNVKNLDLSYCQIQTISFGAFDPMSDSIEILNLQNNQIARFNDGFFNSISNSIQILNLQNNQFANFNDGFFNSILLNNKTQILLEGNKWFCSCDLIPFKVSLIEHSNFLGKLEFQCNTPPEYNTSSVIAANFCDSNPTTPLAPVTTSTTSLTFPIPHTKECISPDESEHSKVVVIEELHQNIEILENDNGDVIVRVDGLKEKSVLIWSSLNDKVTYTSATNDIDCLLGSGTSFIINDLKMNSMYTFCLMGPMKKTVSPLDCISYVKNIDNRVLVWLSENDKSLFYGISSVVCSLCVLIGLAMGFLSHKVKVLQLTRSHRLDSCSTRRTTSATVQYFLEENYDAPPLPARPAEMCSVEEPVYATIRDFATLSSR